MRIFLYYRYTFTIHEKYKFNQLVSLFVKCCTEETQLEEKTKLCDNCLSQVIKYYKRCCPKCYGFQIGKNLCHICNLVFCNKCYDLPKELFPNRSRETFCQHFENKQSIWKQLIFHVFLLIFLPFSGYFSYASQSYRALETMCNQSPSKIGVVITYICYFPILYPFITLFKLLEFMILITADIGILCGCE